MGNTPTRMDRFWAKVAKGSDSECWLWIGAHNSEGYGSFWNGSKLVGAHRFAFENLVGAIADGLTLDHLCRTRDCVNPAHLEPVTNRVNILRGDGPTARHAAKTHCPRGHELSGENLGLWRGGGRKCRECVRARQRSVSPAQAERRRVREREQYRRKRAEQALGETE